MLSRVLECPSFLILSHIPLWIDLVLSREFLMQVYHGPRIFLIEHVLSSYCVPDQVTWCLVWGCWCSLSVPGGETDVHECTGGLPGDNPLESLMASVGCPESFVVRSNTSLFGQVTFPRFPEM